MEKEKSYFISYSLIDENGDFGFGNVNITINNGIETMEDIRNIQEYLCNRNNFKSLIISNYVELKNHK